MNSFFSLGEGGFARPVSRATIWGCAGESGRFGNEKEGIASRFRPSSEGWDLHVACIPQCKCIEGAASFDPGRDSELGECKKTILYLLVAAGAGSML